jgi:hypothetical protein
MLGLYQNTQPFFTASNTENPTGTYRTYVFPLASQAFSGSAVPLNRFDNIRLTMSISSDRDPADTAQDYLKASRVVVTCVGETTALYKGGAASLAMY